MPTVTGIIRTEDGNPAIGIRVQASDTNMRSEEFLGEAITSDGGRYVIEYTQEQFRRAEKKRADLIIRAFDNEGVLRAESDILYNADDARVDLVLESRLSPPGRELSELETLQADIEDLHEAVPYRDFTDQDIRHLFEECRRTRVEPDF